MFVLVTCLCTAPEGRLSREGRSNQWKLLQCWCSEIYKANNFHMPDLSPVCWYLKSFHLVLNNFPVVEWGWDVSLVVEIYLLAVVVHIRELQDTVSARVHGDVTSKSGINKISFLLLHTSIIYCLLGLTYFIAKSLVFISKAFQFPLLKDWNCGATLMK